MQATTVTVSLPLVQGRIPPSLLLVAVQFAVFWPVWQWVAQRMVDVPENRTGVAALLLAAAVVRHAMPKGQSRAPQLLVPSLLMLAYIGLFHLVPIHISAGLAVASLAFTLASIVDLRVRAGLAGLLALALPIVPSMQTHIGYPMRLWVAWLAAAWLRQAGVPVIAEGTCLHVDGMLLLVDEPCSGVHMLWAGLLIAFVVAGFMGMTVRRTLLCVCAIMAIVFAVNLLRAMWLLPFSSEIQHDRLMHDAVGIGVFVVGAPCMVWCAVRIGCWRGKHKEEGGA